METYSSAGNRVHLCLENSLSEAVAIGDAMKILLCQRTVLYLSIYWVSFIKRPKSNMVLSQIESLKKLKLQ